MSLPDDYIHCPACHAERIRVGANGVCPNNCNIKSVPWHEVLKVQKKYHAASVRAKLEARWQAMRDATAAKLAALPQATPLFLQITNGAEGNGTIVSLSGLPGLWREHSPRVGSNGKWAARNGREKYFVRDLETEETILNAIDGTNKSED